MSSSLSVKAWMWTLWVGFYNGLNISDVLAFYMRFLLARGSSIDIGKLASDPQGSVRLHFLRAGTIRRSLPLNALGSDPSTTHTCTPLCYFTARKSHAGLKWHFMKAAVPDMADI